MSNREMIIFNIFYLIGGFMWGIIFALKFLIKKRIKIKEEGANETNKKEERKKDY